jgi:cobalt-precorrin-5B (C1)-methyltransferase
MCAEIKRPPAGGERNRRPGELREGITTGTCAAAALKAALLLLARGGRPEAVEVKTPQDLILRVPVGGARLVPGGAAAWTVKDAGDDIDITDGAKICVEVVLTDKPGWLYEAGEGVGTARKKGLFIPVGAPAINPGPRLMMDKVLTDLLPAGRGARVTVSVPGGKLLAQKTLNSMLGIENGLSILGTTGIVRPMSEEAFKSALLKQYDVLTAAGVVLPVLTPGKIGERIAVSFGIPGDTIVQIGNFAGFMLEKAVAYGFRDILLIGHIGKLIKLSGGIFYTHSGVADGRQEIFAAYLSILGAPRELLREVLRANTTEAIMELVKEHKLTEVYALLAERAAERCRLHVKGAARVGVAFADIKGRLLAVDKVAARLSEETGWTLSIRNAD